jgi:hypothetical protein
MYSGLARAASLALAPLTTALSDVKACAALLAQIGYRLGLTRDAHDRIATLLPVGDTLQSIAARVDALDPDHPDPAAVAELVQDLEGVADALAALEQLDDADLSVLPGVLSTPQAWVDIGQTLPEHLLARYLAEEHRPLFLALRLLGICTSQSTAGATRYRLRWQQLASALADPAAAVGETLGWGPAFAAWPLQRELGLTLSRLGLAVTVRARQAAVASAIAGAPVDLPTGLQSDVVLLSGETPDGDAVQVGLTLACDTTPTPSIYVGNLASGALDADQPLDDTWIVTASGTFDGTATIGALIEPTGVTLVRGAASLDASLALSGAPATPWILLGTAAGTRAELDGVLIEVGLTGTVRDPEAYVLTRIDQDAFRFVLDLGDADSFLRGVIGEDPLAITAGGELRWGTSTGLRFDGGLGLAVTLAIERDIGPVHVESLTLTIGSGETDAQLAATAAAGLTLGPFEARVAGLGAALQLTSGDTGLTGLDAELSFVPPSQIGLELDAGETARGAGFVAVDAESGRYTGALELEFLDVGLEALVVVDTRLPGDPDGWSFFASISAAFPSLPLGFGFFLSGVGGLVALNRTMDVHALASGLKSGSLDALLFPDDVLAEAPALVAGLDAWFPQAAGSTVLGVAAEITWGAPKPLVTSSLGILLSFPELDIAVIGTVSMVLPSEDESLLELHMDALGVVDTSEQTVTVTASLYDSALLRTIQLSGDMAMYVQAGENPFFLLSIGGYNEHFQPPHELPASVRNLQRVGYEVTLSEDLWFGLSGYFAVTPNTLQFGAQASIVASAKFLGVTYTASGSLHFDVLLKFSPFSFSADVLASVTITAEGDELLAVTLHAHLSGPDPWFATGYAQFEFLGIGVRFEITVGGAPGAEALPRTNVLEAVLTALGDLGAWHELAPASPSVLLASEDDDSSATGRMRPDAELRATQGVAPLDRPMDVYGIYDIDGPKTLTIDGAGIDGATGTSWAAAEDWFAPAQYDRMTKTEALAAPSYEQMAAGVDISTGSTTFGDTQSVTPDFETAVLSATATVPLEAPQPLVGSLASATAALAIDTARRPAGPRRVTVAQRFTVDQPTWSVVDAETGARVGAPMSYAGALRSLRDDSAPRAERRVAPAYAARAA